MRKWRLIDQKNVGDGLASGEGADGGRIFDRTPHLVKEGFVNDFVHEGAFARTADSGNGNESAQGKGGAEIFEIVAVGSLNPEPRVAFLWAGAPGGQGNGAAAGKIGASGGVFDFRESGGRAGVEKLAAFAPRTGAEFENVFGGADDGFIVFDHENGVAGGAKFAEEIEEASGVAGVEADAGFVEDKEGAGQTRAEASGEVDALEFSAGESSGRAIEREVAETHAEKKAEAMANIFQGRLGGGVFGFYLLQEVGKIGQGERVEFGHGFSGEAPVGRLGPITLAAAGGAGTISAVAGEQNPDMHFVGFRFEPTKETANTVPVP